MIRATKKEKITGEFIVLISADTQDEPNLYDLAYQLQQKGFKQNFSIDISNKRKDKTYIEFLLQNKNYYESFKQHYEKIRKEIKIKIQ